MTYVADSERYEALTHSRTGHSGLLLPPLSLGLRQNFGDRAVL
jgi:L-glyceraldehyde 3-phosphate reductase